MKGIKKIIKALIKIIDFIVPPVIQKLIKQIYLLLRYGIRYYSTLHQYDKCNDSLVVVGNGPSLKITIEKYIDQILTHDRMTVNGFANTDYYEILRPNFYVLADPVFFNKYDCMTDRIKTLSLSLADSLKSKTIWNMTLIVPSYARKSDFVKDILCNNFIKLLYYNPYDLFLPLSKRNEFFLWNHNLNAPLSQTVLNTCLNFGIYAKYKQIYLIGADTSWIENLHVDQNNNMLYTIDKHFYGEKKIYIYSDENNQVPQRLDKELQTIMRASEFYWKLKSYAEFNNVIVYNASEYSLIDAFDRKTIQ